MRFEINKKIFYRVLGIYYSFILLLMIPLAVVYLFWASITTLIVSLLFGEKGFMSAISQFTAVKDIVSNTFEIED